MKDELAQAVAEERAFQDWYARWAKQMNLNPNPYDPRHLYDYRAAWQAGEEPRFDPGSNAIHWPSKYKMKEHPRAVIRLPDGTLFNTITGEVFEGF